MKFSNILLFLSTTLCVVNCHDIDCKSVYKVVEKDKCFDILGKNEISLSLFNSLNPDVDCENLTPDLEVCVNGEIKYSLDGSCGPGKGSCPNDQCCSKNGFCGTSQTYCGTGCNPKYGICSDEESQSVPEIKIGDDDYDEIAVKEIAKILSMNETDAKKFYESANEAMALYENAYLEAVDYNLSVKHCKNKCKRAYDKFENLLNSSNAIFNLDLYNKYLESNEQSPVSNDELLELCQNKCYIIQEVNKYVEEDIDEEVEEENEIENKKNENIISCKNPSDAKFEVTNNYRYGYNKYVQSSGSVETALSKVNGCSIPVIMKKYNTEDAGLFVSACNSHDICYGCQGGKANCDLKFLNNMKTLCKNLKKNSPGCRLLADTFYTAAKIGARKNYDAYKNNEIRSSCAYCGAPIIQKQLLVEPYFT